MDLNFEKLNGLVPVIIQDNKTNSVLMLGFMNQEALSKTQEEGRVTFYSRTNERLWTKGEESGNYLNVVEILEDCDQDTLLVKVNPEGPVCHTGQMSCFGDMETVEESFLDALQDLLQKRKAELPKGSYTAKLFEKGTDSIAQKVGEEAVELVIEAKGDNDVRFLNEGADLLFHMLILFVDRGFRLEDVVRILEERH